MNGLTVGSLFSGYGGLDIAVEQVLGARPVWFADNGAAAARVLAHRWPGVPNHGDLTTINWATVEPVDVLTGGFPCQDVSDGGRRAGLIRPRRRLDPLRAVGGHGHRHRPPEAPAGDRRERERTPACTSR